jgi:hypothetical protein
MVPLVFGLIILVCVLAYHIIYNKEGFEDVDSGAQLVAYLKSVLPAALQTRMDNFETNVNKYYLESNDIDELSSILDAIKPYYNYPQIPFNALKYGMYLSIVDKYVINNTIVMPPNRNTFGFLTQLRNKLQQAKADAGMTIVTSDQEKKLLETIEAAEAAFRAASPNAGAASVNDNAYGATADNTTADNTTATSTATTTTTPDETDAIIAEMTKSIPESVVRRMGQSNAANIMAFYEAPTKDGLFKLFDMIDMFKPYYTATMPYNQFKAIRMKKGLEEMKSIISPHKKPIVQEFINNINALTIEHSLYNVSRFGTAPVVIDERPKAAADSKLEVSGSTDDTFDKIKPMIMNEMKSMRKDIVNDVRQIVEKEGNSPAQEQGQEWAASAANKKPCPMCYDACDNDDYIRKDSIPCWNCNLPRST